MTVFVLAICCACVVQTFGQNKPTGKRRGGLYNGGSPVYQGLSYKEQDFRQEAYFEDEIFQLEAHFGNAHFGSRASFSNTTFKEGAIFDGALLPDTLEFSNVKEIGAEIDFTNARKDSGVCHINLLRSDISKIKLRYDIFRLYFPDETRIEEKSNVYEALLAKFKADRYDDSYETLDIEYRKFLYAIRGQWVWNALQNYWWNYGYSKEWIFVWIGYFLWVFTIINWFYYDYLSTKVYSIKSLSLQQMPTGWKRHFLKPLLALTYTCFIFFGVKIDPEGIKELSGFRRYFALFYIFTVYSVGLICLAYLANFIVTK